MNINQKPTKDPIGYLLRPIEIEETEGVYKTHKVTLDTAIIERADELFFINGLSRISQAIAARDEETAKAERELLEKLIIDKGVFVGRGAGEGSAKAAVWRRFKESNSGIPLKCNHFYPIHKKSNETRNEIEIEIEIS
jgi:hypothetical protein